MTEPATRRRSLAAVLMLMITASVATASFYKAASTGAAIDTWTERQAELAEAVVVEVVNGIFNDLEAVAAFIEESDPDAESFNRFVASIDGTADAVGLGHVAIVQATQVAEHVEEQTRERGYPYAVRRLSDSLEVVPLDPEGRTELYPVQVFAFGDFIRPYLKPNVPAEELALGIDPGFNPEWRKHIGIAAAATGPNLSDFIDVRLDVVVLDRVFFASVPVRDTDGTVTGLVAAPIVEALLLRDLDSRVLDEVDWEVIPRGSAPTRISPEHAGVFALEMQGAVWSLAVAPNDAALARLQGQPLLVTGAAAGLLAALSALVVWLYVDRRNTARRDARMRRVAEDKDRFLASVSHELRTPLTVVSGVVNELHDRPQEFSAEDQSDLMEMLVEQTDELAGIVEDLLIAARSDMGKVVIHFKQVDLADETRRAMETSGVSAPTQGEAGVAWADDQRVRQILRNLLSNAGRYGGGDVRVEFAASMGWVDVAVADNGPPIATELRSVIFEPYESTHRPDLAVRSVGLGLYISRNLAEAMGGRLDYGHDGRWGRFRLRLPQPEVPEAQPRTAKQAVSTQA